MTRSLLLFVLAAAACLLVTASASAQALVPVQGTLYELDGTPIDGTVAVTFTLHSDSGATEDVWTSTQNVVATEGLFTAYLGSAEALDASLFRDYTRLWLTIGVRDGVDLGPFPLGLEAYAGFASYCGDADTLQAYSVADILDAAADAGDIAYAPISHRHDWDELDEIPSGFADGTDDERSDGEILAVVEGGGYLRGTSDINWSQLTGVPSGFADGLDNVRSDSEIRSAVGGQTVEFYDCTWTANGADPYITAWDGTWTYECPSGQLMRGIRSRHDNDREDRRFGFQCCRMRIVSP